MIRRLIGILLIGVAVVGGFNQLNAFASAEPTLWKSPLDALQRQQNDAVWTIRQMTFQSDYPNGFSFILDAESSGGEIVQAEVVWNRLERARSETRRITREVGAFDPMLGMFIADWRANRSRQIPPWIVFEYHWALRDSAGNRYETGPVIAEYADETRAWRRSESEDVIVIAMDDLSPETEQLVLDAMAGQHDKYVAVWGDTLPYRPRIVLFADLDAWFEWRTADNLSGQQGIVVGETFDEWGLIAQVPTGDHSDELRELAYSTVLHEVEHLYQGEFLSERTLFDVPRWFTEGDATFFEFYQSYDYVGRVRARAAEGDLPPLLVASADAPGARSNSGREAYDIGYSVFVWMEETNGGLEAHAALMRLLADDTPFFEALEQATGLQREGIERSWRLWLGASEYAPTLVPTWTPAPLIIVTPTPVGS